MHALNILQSFFLLVKWIKLDVFVSYLNDLHTCFPRDSTTQHKSETYASIRVVTPYVCITETIKWCCCTSELKKCLNVNAFSVVYLFASHIHKQVQNFRFFNSFKPVLMREFVPMDIAGGVVCVVVRSLPLNHKVRSLNPTPAECLTRAKSWLNFPSLRGR